MVGGDDGGSCLALWAGLAPSFSVCYATAPSCVFDVGCGYVYVGGETGCF